MLHLIIYTLYREDSGQCPCFLLVISTYQCSYLEKCSLIHFSGIAEVVVINAFVNNSSCTQTEKSKNRHEC